MASSAIERVDDDTNAKYKKLVKILTTDPRYAKAMADVTAPSQHDKLADSLTALSLQVGTSLKIIKALIELEFQRKHTHPFTILRVNSIVSKMMGKYVKGVGSDYLNELLGDLIRGLYERDDMDLELDKSRLTKHENVEEQIQENTNALLKLLQSFLDRILDKRLLSRMPREIRAICYFMKKNCGKYNLNFETIILPLMSGFLVLRYICPAITVPSNWGITQKMPEGNVRKNLTMIAKVLQKLANGEVYDNENSNLVPLNKFIEANNTKLLQYLKELPEDPLRHSEDDEPFADLLDKPILHNVEDMSFELKDLLFIHQMIYEYGFELVVSLHSDVSPEEVVVREHETLFLSLIQELGPPPTSELKKKMDEIHSGVVKHRGDNEINRLRKGTVLGPRADMAPRLPKPTMKKRENLKGKKYSEIETLVEKSIEFLMRKVNLFDLTDLEASRFIYIGKPTREGVPTIYLILHRIKPQFLEHSDRLIIHIYKTIGQYLNNPYVLVIDLSWANLDEELQSNLYRVVIGFTRLIPSVHLMNCHRIIVNQPTETTLSATIELLYLMEDDIRNDKVKMVYEWPELSAEIEPAKIVLPTVSRKFLPISHQASKVINQEKKQEVILKITNESILTISPSSGAIKSEIVFSRMKEIVTKKESPLELTIKFEMEADREIMLRGASYLSHSHSNSDGTQVRRYECLSEYHRDLLVEAIQTSVLNAVSASAAKQCFQVLKKNKKRGFKLTNDSILMLRDNIIEREISFSTLQNYVIDEESFLTNILHLTFWSGGKQKSYDLDCGEKAQELLDSLTTAHHQFLSQIELEKNTFTARRLSPAVDRFFSSVNFAVKDSFKVEKIAEDIKRLHKQISSEIDLPELLTFMNKQNKDEITLNDIVQSWILAHKTRTILTKRKNS